MGWRSGIFAVFNTGGQGIKTMLGWSCTSLLCSCLEKKLRLRENNSDFLFIFLIEIKYTDNQLLFME